MIAVDAKGVPLAGILASAQKSEYNLALPTIDAISIESRPNHPKKRAKKLIADRGYDAKWLRQEISKRRITPYIPKRRKQGEKDQPKYNTKIKPYYKRRWPVERTFAWLGNYRRILIRWENKISNYAAFFKLACILICLREVLK